MNLDRVKGQASEKAQESRAEQGTDWLIKAGVRRQAQPSAQSPHELGPKSRVEVPNLKESVESPSVSSTPVDCMSFCGCEDPLRGTELVLKSGSHRLSYKLSLDLCFGRIFDERISLNARTLPPWLSSIIIKHYDDLLLQ